MYRLNKNNLSLCHQHFDPESYYGKKNYLSPADYLYQSRLNQRPVFRDEFYSGLFSLKNCSVSVLLHVSLSCRTIILYSLGCRERVSNK